MAKKNNTKTRIAKRDHKKKKVRRRGFLILIPFLIVFLGIASWAAYLYIKADTVLSDSYEDNGREKSDLRDEKVDPKYDNVSILIIGVDQNEKRGNKGHALSDTLILATLNEKEKSVNMLTIPRDSYVYIPEVDRTTKITHAHAYGGPQATIDTVENLLDIPVDYYVKVNFDAFVEVVDSLNGINVEVPYELYESNSNDERDAIHLLPGEHLLDGEEALALARTRKHDNDIERGKRQQDIIKAAIKKATSVSSILKYDNIIDAVGENMTTNMSFSEMKSFISYGTSGKDLDIESLTLEGYDYQPADMYFYQLDENSLSETKIILKNHLDIESDSSTANHSNDSYNATGSDEESSY